MISGRCPIDSISTRLFVPAVVTHRTIVSPIKRGVMKKIIVVCLVLVLMGCAGAGKYFTIDDANKVTNGMTREEVIAIMGTTPYQITGQGKTFVWSYAKMGMSGRMDSRAVKFSFDENGKTYGVPLGGAYGDIQKYQDK